MDKKVRCAPMVALLATTSLVVANAALAAPSDVNANNLRIASNAVKIDINFVSNPVFSSLNQTGTSLGPNNNNNNNDIHNNRCGEFTKGNIYKPPLKNTAPPSRGEASLGYIYEISQTGFNV